MNTPRRALILVDVQQEYFSGPLEIQFPAHADSLPRITAAIDAATAAGIPIAVIQHSAGDEAPVFNPTMDGFALHPEIARRQSPAWKSVTKQFGTVFAGTDVLNWLREHDIDTITLAGYMTNNCIIASAAESETHGLAAEVLSDATGSINIANDAGFADAKTVHTTLMALLHSNFAAVATAQAWTDAIAEGSALAKDNLGSSAVLGAQRVAAL
ncbi:MULTISPECIES: isochorismatase family protein [Cryobacterium]|uniref:Isochorismatase n=1 Tax=Cryobacterium zongtaii TaxID=1259217 RepID=A0A2S3ZFK6_9MICO|nr:MULTISPECIES: isochorismatase family protein [Cryobacterium]POH64560.1 isochorismatase [Cryobacterium zongtaii]POH65891.1 isochorismatase [Cryobacterium zongtaii]TFC46270.1 isochorismatase family protein [Cryobacterium sp. TMN-39-2]